MRKLHERQHVRAGIGSGLHQGPEICVALSDNARKWCCNPRVRIDRFIMGELRLRLSYVAPRGLQVRLSRLHLRLRCQITTLNIVYFLLRYQPWFALRHAVQPFELQVQDFMLGFQASQLILRVCHVILHAFRRGSILLE